MALAFDNFTHGNNSSISHQVISSSNTILLAFIQGRPGETITGATYNGVAMTQIDNVAVSSGFSFATFYLLSPASGTHTLSVSGTAGTGAGCAVSYTGAKQSGQPDAHVAAEHTQTGAGNDGHTVTVVAPNSWIVTSHFSFNADPDAVFNGTERGVVGDLDAVDSNGPLAAGSQSIGWHWPSTDKHAYGIISIAPFLENPTKSIKINQAVNRSYTY